MIINRYDELKKDKFPYFPVLGLIWFLNIIFSTHFISLFLAGAVFIFFIQFAKNKYYYLLFFSFLTFSFIETVHGLTAFSLTLTAVLIYTIIIPQIKHLFSSKIFAQFLYLFLFYFLFFLFTYLISGKTDGFVLLFIMNFMIDSLIAGFFL